MAGRFSDNILNRTLTNNTPKFPTPELAKVVPTSGDINTSDIRNNMLSAQKSANKATRNAGGSSSAQSNRIAANLAATIKGQTDLEGQVNRAEQQQKERNMINAQTVINKNTDTINDFRTNSLVVRPDAIQGRKSENYANMSEDLTAARIDNNQRILDRQTIEMIMIKYRDSGVWDRKATPWLKEFIKNQEQST